MSDRLDRALSVLLNSLESATGLQESYESGAFGATVQKLPTARMHLAGSSSWRSCKGKPHFDTLTGQLGAIWWPPTRDENGELLPVICGISRQGQEFSIKLAIIRPDPTGALEGLGVRLETGHSNGAGGPGRHDFHHAQLFSHAAKGIAATRLTKAGQWLPEQQPSIPVAAHNALDLVWATAVLVYGRRGAYTPFNSLRQEDQEDFDRYLGCLG